MTAILRNALLAAVAISALAGSAVAGQQTVKNECDKNGNQWAGRCCGVGDSNCLGGEGHDRGDRDGQKR